MDLRFRRYLGDYPNLQLNATETSICLKGTVKEPNSKEVVLGTPCIFPVLPLRGSGEELGSSEFLQFGVPARNLYQLAWIRSCVCFKTKLHYLCIFHTLEGISLPSQLGHIYLNTSHSRRGRLYTSHTRADIRHSGQLTYIRQDR